MRRDKQRDREGGTSLFEETTDVMEVGEDHDAVPRRMLEYEILKYLSITAPNILRGSPFLESVYEDPTYGVPHIRLGLRIPFKDATEATLLLLRQELENVAEWLVRRDFYKNGFAISLVVCPGKEGSR